jgi:stearoyl-CoA desaturase (delta-9 desaturase)
VSHSISLRNFNWTNGIFLIGYHVGLLIGLPIYFAYNTPSLALILVSVALLFLTEIGIGAAYHRFYSHRCFTLSRPAEVVLLFLATLATQGSVLQWSHDHRLHHKHVDTDRDPYSIKKGFWFAHCLWLFEKWKPIDEKVVPDLLRNPLVVFQHRFAGTLSVVSNIALFLVVGWALNDYLGAFVLTWWTRLLLSHHLTWFINSLAHYWGSQTFSKEHTAVDNYIIALLTVGEGYHNYHHTFPADYRNGVRWFHFDPTKWTIWLLSKVGLAGNLRRFNAYKIKKRLVTEDRKLLLGALAHHAREKRTALEERVEQLARQMQIKLNRISRLVEERKLKRASLGRARRRAMRMRIRALERSFKRDLEAWSQLYGLIHEAQPA